MPVQDPKLKDSSKTWKLIALAASAACELAAGPLAGYMLGTWLKQYFGMNDLMISIAVFAGFILGVTAVIWTIQKINNPDN